MNKQDFIDRLRMALNGRVSPGLVMDNVNYYEDYINTEIREGPYGRGSTGESGRSETDCAYDHSDQWW